MNFGWMLELEELLRPHWKNIIVLVLYQEGPLGFADLQRSMGTAADRPVSDAKLSQNLKQLRAAGAIRREFGDNGRPYWVLENSGIDRAVILTEIGQALTARGELPAEREIPKG